MSVNIMERSAEVSIPRLNFAISRQDLILAAFEELGYDRPTEEQAERILYKCRATVRQ